MKQCVPTDVFCFCFLKVRKPWGLSRFDRLLVSFRYPGCLAGGPQLAVGSPVGYRGRTFVMRFGLVDWLMDWLLGKVHLMVFYFFIFFYIGWLVGLLAGWLDALTDWSVDCSVWLVDRLVGELGSWLVDWYVCWLFDWWVSWYRKLLTATDFLSPASGHQLKTKPLR